jgi:hypothetical protein
MNPPRARVHLGVEVMRIGDVPRDDRVGIWAATDDVMHVRFADPVRAQDVRDLVAALDARHDNDFNPTLQLEAVEGAVARVGVSDDEQLGERMGSGGAAIYMASATYTLTPLPRIDTVYFAIEEGSQAPLGYSSRVSQLAWTPNE